MEIEEIEEKIERLERERDGIVFIPHVGYVSKERAKKFIEVEL